MLSFSKIEIRDLTISVIVLSLIFASYDISAVPLTILIVLAVFISHELSHKFLAQRYGCFAEYRMWPLGLLLGALTALIPGGIVFAAPGAVVIYPYSKKFAFKVVRLTKKEYGKISVAGPLINVIVGLTSLLISFFYSNSILLLISRISFFLALFNLIPIGPLDGMKILAWDRRIWVSLFGLSVIGFIFLNLV